MSATREDALGRLGGERLGPEASGIFRRVEEMVHLLPKGQLLPEHIWRRRHATIVALLLCHVLGLTAFGLLQGQSLPHMLVEGGALALVTYVAGSERSMMKVRVAAASVGLISCSAVLVHLWGGAIEAHFHFFVMIGVLTLYQDWMPFLVAIGYVVVHHGIAGVLDPERVQPPERGRASLAGH